MALEQTAQIEEAGKAKESENRKLRCEFCNGKVGNDFYISPSGIYFFCSQECFSGWAYVVQDILHISFVYSELPREMANQNGRRFR